MAAKRLFGAGVFLYALLFWVVRYVPTQDGPSHLANAAVLADVVSSGPEAYYYVAWRPLPNWTYYAAAAPMTLALGPAVGEKILLTVYLLAFAAAVVALARAAGATTAAGVLAALPLALSYPFHMGFFNYMLGAAAALAALAFYVQNRGRVGWRAASVPVLLAIFAYFCHLLAALLLLGMVYVAALGAAVVPAWRAGVPLRRRLAFLGALLAGAVLPAWFLLTAPRGEYVWGRVTERLALFGEGWPLISFGPGQRPLGWLAAALLGAAVVGIIRAAARRRLGAPRAQLATVAAALFVVYLFAPEEAAGGSVVAGRLLPLVFALVFVAAPDGAGRRARAALTAAAAAFALVAWADVGYYYLRWDRELRSLEAADPYLRPGAPTVFIDYTEYRPGEVRPAFHAGAYYALRVGVLDLANYEAELDYFPVRFKPAPGGGRPPAATLAGGLDVDAAALRPWAEYVVTYRADAYYLHRLGLGAHYDAVLDDPEVKVFRRR
jgi:hypothetical protein